MSQWLTEKNRIIELVTNCNTRRNHSRKTIWKSPLLVSGKVFPVLIKLNAPPPEQGYWKTFLYGEAPPRGTNPWPQLYTICGRKDNRFIYLPYQMVSLSRTYSRKTTRFGRSVRDIFKDLFKYLNDSFNFLPFSVLQLGKILTLWLQPEKGTS